MALSARFTVRVKSLVRSFLGHPEDPSLTLENAYRHQLKQLGNLRRTVSDIVTNEKRLELQQPQIQQEMQKLDDLSRQALAAGQEDLARRAIERKLALQRYAAANEQLIAQVKARERQLIDLERRFAARIEFFRTRKDIVSTMKALWSAADLQAKAQEALASVSTVSAEINLAVLVRDAWAEATHLATRARAMHELIRSGTLLEFDRAARHKVTHLLPAISDRAEVGRQLAALKASLRLTAGELSSPGDVSDRC